MKRLSELVDEGLALALERAIERQEFPGLSYRHALELLLSDGIIPASDLPVESVLRLEDWARSYRARAGAEG